MVMKKYDVITSGYVSMDHMLKIRTPAVVGFTSLIENKTNSKIYYGGCSVNIAYALCRLGLKSMPILRVGDDYEEIGFKDFLINGNVPTDGITRVHNETTSVCYLIQDNNGEHITIFYPGAMDDARRDKPEIPAIGLYGIPMRDDVEFEYDLASREPKP